MKYYVYFDAYGHARRAISEEQLAGTYQNDPNRFLAAMCRSGSNPRKGCITGHVGILNFNSDKELKDYLESMGDEITGFYKADADSRPYNF
jgi:hypothetical protein